MVQSSHLTLSAPAKINLSLHILGRREDGYHELEGLVAFADYGDELSLHLCSKDDLAADSWSLELSGPFASGLQRTSSPDNRNLVLKAAELLDEMVSPALSGRFFLDKKLPIASGMGGGSSDAAAALTLLQRMHPSTISEDVLYRIARNLGADVPMCLSPTAQYVRGIGEITESVAFLEPLQAVLINPGISVATGDVFRLLDAPLVMRKTVSPASASMPGSGDSRQFIDWLQKQRNDLEAPALEIAPQIGTVLVALRHQKDCRLARMSGSGATCFGLFETEEAAQQAADKLAGTHPDWWVQAVKLM